MTDDRTRYVVYARQSLTRHEDDSLSIEMQVRACREFVAARGGVVVGVYEEPNTRGWRTDRPQFNAMLDAFRDGRADVAVVFKLSRFARNLMHQETVLREVEDAGGELVSVTEPYLNGSPMVRQILGAVNEQAKRDQGDFLRAAFSARARRGKPHGYAPIGYRKGDDGDLVIDDATVETVRRIFREALAGRGARTIALDLNADGILTQRGREWTHATVLGVIRNPVYAGHVQHGGEVVARDTHPAIVTDDEYERAVSAISRRRGIRRKDGDTSWADGFVYHSCGRRMYLTAWRRAPDGETQWRFRCNAQFDRRRMGDRACRDGAGSMFAHQVEDAFLSRLITALESIATPEQARRNIEASRDSTQREREAQRKRLDRRIADVTSRRDRLLDMTLAGRVDDEMYVMRDAALKDELARLVVERETIPADVPVERLEARHREVLRVSEALPIIAHHAPQRLPEMLHALDVRLVIGEDAPLLRFGDDVRPFVS